MRKRLTISAKELGLLPDFRSYHERTLYRKYKRMRERLGIPRSERMLTIHEVAQCLGVESRDLQQWI